MKFHSKSVEEHAEVPLPDRGQWEALTERFGRREHRPPKGLGDPNRCFVVSIRSRHSADASQARLTELVGLVEAQGDRVVGEALCELNRPDPRTLLRRGVAARIASEALDCAADLIVVDAELSPSQMRNLEDATGLPVSDREAVILNVFALHASTPRAKMQVEIAHLEYLRPRIRGIGLNMDQQAGGTLKARGPGETASELMARRLDERLARHRAALRALERKAEGQRKERSGSTQIALVGYTNAGKTSLMNALSATNLSVRNRPFETLDTTSRCLSRHGGDIILSDTVGFIRHLPERLYVSFESTLAAVREADLLLVVVDASDRERLLHLRIIDDVLQRLGAEHIPRFYALNKVDRLEADPALMAELERATQPHSQRAVSAHDAALCERLKDEIVELAQSRQPRREFFIPYHAGALLRQLYARCRVVASEAKDSGLQCTVEGDSAILDALQEQLVRVRDGRSPNGTAVEPDSQGELR